jgi:hypothetical protein
VSDKHEPDCRWEKTTPYECEFRNTHFYCPHPEHGCTCELVACATKAAAILDAIRKTDVGSDIIIQNEDMSIYCILTVKCKEHPEKLDEDGGKVLEEP